MVYLSTTGCDVRALLAVKSSADGLDHVTNHTHHTLRHRVHVRETHPPSILYQSHENHVQVYGHHMNVM